MGLKNNSVYLESNDEKWHNLFIKEKNILINIFNEDNYAIEHVGSTSIKGLLAKPIIDIVIGIDLFANFKKYLKDLEKIYTIKNNIDKKEILLIKENKKETFCLIHVLEQNDDRYKNMIKFRNILNSNPKILKEYEKLKQDLAEKYPNDRQEYTKSKNEFIQSILKNTN